MTNYREKNRRLASLWRERLGALGLRGKKADDAALEFMVGAAAGARLAGDDDLADHFGRIAYLVVAVRGSLGLSMLGEE